jgi:hypothetical protein
VTCADLGQARSAVVALGAELSAHERVRQVLIRNDTGAWNTDPGYPDGLYLGVRYRAREGAEWNLDLWFVDEPDRQPDLAHLRDLAPTLDEQRRARILAIKVARADLAPDRRLGSSFDVYRAVLDGGVTSLAEFDGWLATQDAAPDGS